MLSVVENRDNKDELLVRARVEGDIERVFGDFMGDHPMYDIKVFQMRRSDYEFRAFIPRELVAEVMYTSINEIDYDNFKNSMDKNDHSRKRAYMDVWQAMFDLQERELGSNENLQTAYYRRSLGL